MTNLVFKETRKTLVIVRNLSFKCMTKKLKYELDYIRTNGPNVKIVNKLAN